jgi:hypothetical protein
MLCVISSSPHHHRSLTNWRQATLLFVSKNCMSSIMLCLLASCSVDSARDSLSWATDVPGIIALVSVAHHAMCNSSVSGRAVPMSKHCLRILNADVPRNTPAFGSRICGCPLCDDPASTLRRRRAVTVLLRTYNLSPYRKTSCRTAISDVRISDCPQYQWGITYFAARCYRCGGLDTWL